MSKTRRKDLDTIWSNVWNNLDSMEALKSISSDETMRWKLKYAPKGKHIEAMAAAWVLMYFISKS